MLLEIAVVARPHGLHGRVVVDLVTNRTERLQQGSRLITDAGVLEVASASRHGSRWVVAFRGVDDRAAAEKLRGTVLAAEPIEDPEALWVHELIGSQVVDDTGRPLGTVEALQANPASDLLVLSGGQLIPLRFVVERSPGSLKVQLPAGLLDL